MQREVQSTMPCRVISDIDTTQFFHWKLGIICESIHISALCRDLSKDFFCWYDMTDFTSLKVKSCFRMELNILAEASGPPSIEVQEEALRTLR